MSNNIVAAYKLHGSAKLPKKGTELSGCYDVFACLHHENVKFHGAHAPIQVNDFGTEDANIVLKSNDLALIPTGIIFAIPEGRHLKFYSRSGHTWKSKLIVLNSPAVIDADYTLESFVLVYNGSDNPYKITTGDAIAQCELCTNVDVFFGEIGFEQLDEFIASVNKKSSRNGGLGSTGK